MQIIKPFLNLSDRPDASNQWKHTGELLSANSQSQRSHEVHLDWAPLKLPLLSSTNHVWVFWHVSQNQPIRDVYHSAFNQPRTTFTKYWPISDTFYWILKHQDICPSNKQQVYRRILVVLGYQGVELNRKIYYSYIVYFRRKKRKKKGKDLSCEAWC